jgi:hypothetical protein
MSRAVRPLAVAIALLIGAGLVAVASLPTGSASPEAAIDPGGRVAASVRVDDARVLLVSRSGRLEVVVAYKGQKGWLAAPLDPAPAGTVAAWTGTSGTGDERVPALAAVFGRTDGSRVRVRWSDGRTTSVETAVDGTYLAARPGRIGSARVDVLDGRRTVLTVEGP